MIVVYTFVHKFPALYLLSCCKPTFSVHSTLSVVRANLDTQLHTAIVRFLYTLSLAFVIKGQARSLYIVLTMGDCPETSIILQHR